MKGLELSRKYFETYGKPMLEKEFGQYVDLIAVGLAGQGSECFGFDDEFSRDHDFGPGFCIWIPEKYNVTIGKKMQQFYDALPTRFEGYKISAYAPERKERVGVHSIEEFYCRLIGRPDAPKTNREWFLIPEKFLAPAVNGQVFCDPLGKFTRIRQELLNFYPEDVLKKKLAAKCAVMGQAGQYNYVRCVRRSAYDAASLACNQFVMAALGALYLLNGIYMPFYKWAFRGTEQFTKLQSVVEDIRMLTLLSDVKESTRKILLIEKICIQVRDAVIRKSWSYGTESFLMVHAERIMNQVTDPALQMLPIMAGE